LNDTEAAAVIFVLSQQNLKCRMSVCEHARNCYDTKTADIHTT